MNLQERMSDILYCMDLELFYIPSIVMIMSVVITSYLRKFWLAPIIAFFLEYMIMYISYWRRGLDYSDIWWPSLLTAIGALIFSFLIHQIQMIKKEKKEREK